MSINLLDWQYKKGSAFLYQTSIETAAPRLKSQKAASQKQDQKLKVNILSIPMPLSVVAKDSTVRYSAMRVLYTSLLTI